MALVQIDAASASLPVLYSISTLEALYLAADVHGLRNCRQKTEPSHIVEHSLLKRETSLY
jgi:hypothetical protein